MKICFPRSNHFDPKGSSGFTLLEVMVAVSLLAIGLAVLFGSQSRSLSFATETRFNTIAPMLAATKFADLESKGINMGSDEGDFDDEYPGYTWKLEVELADLDSLRQLQSLDPPLLKVALTISWSETNFKYPLIYYIRQEQ